MSLFEQFILFLVSLFANVFSAFAGGGAGLIQLPALIFLGLPFGVALATHKVASVALGLGATIRHLRNGQFDSTFIILMMVFGVPGVVAGASVILSVNEVGAEIALGLLTIGLGVYSLLKPSLGQHDKGLHRDRHGLLLGGLGLFVIGVLNGSLTSGTGLFATLWLVRWFGMDYKAAVAYTLIMVGLLWNGTGAITLGLLGDIHWAWLPALLIGSLLGGYLGAHLAILKGNRWIKRGYEAITLLVGISLIGRHLL